MLRWRVEKVLKRTGMTPTRFGRESIGDPSFVFQLRQGRDPRPATAGRVERFIAKLEASYDER